MVKTEKHWNNGTNFDEFWQATAPLNAVSIVPKVKKIILKAVVSYIM